MHVNSLLVTRDPQIQDIVSNVFAGIDLRLREYTSSTIELVSRSHFDGFIIEFPVVCPKELRLPSGFLHFRGRHLLTFAPIDVGIEIKHQMQ